MANGWGLVIVKEDEGEGEDVMEGLRVFVHGLTSQQEATSYALKYAGNKMLLQTVFFSGERFTVQKAAEGRREIRPVGETIKRYGKPHVCVDCGKQFIAFLKEYPACCAACGRTKAAKAKAKEGG